MKSQVKELQTSERLRMLLVRKIFNQICESNLLLARSQVFPAFFSPLSNFDNIKKGGKYNIFGFAFFTVVPARSPESDLKSVASPNSHNDATRKHRIFLENKSVSRQN